MLPALPAGSSRAERTSALGAELPRRWDSGRARLDLALIGASTCGALPALLRPATGRLFAVARGRGIVAGLEGVVDRDAPASAWPAPLAWHGGQVADPTAAAGGDVRRELAAWTTRSRLCPGGRHRNRLAGVRHSCSVQHLITDARPRRWPPPPAWTSASPTS